MQRRLAAAGIHAELHTESKVEKVLSFFRASAGVRIDVPREEFEAAFRLVYDWNTEQKGSVEVGPSREPPPSDVSVQDGKNRFWHSS